MVDKNFDLIAYLKYKGFEMKRGSDKRDTLVLRSYYDSWQQENKEVSVTIHYNYGCNRFMMNAGLMMEVYMYPQNDTSNYYEVLYKGLQPLNFDDAETLFEMILPNEKLLRLIDGEVMDNAAQAMRDLENDI